MDEIQEVRGIKVNDKTVRQAAKEALLDFKGTMINDSQAEFLAEAITARANCLNAKETNTVNSERFVVRISEDLTKEKGESIFHNLNFNFIGSKEDAREFAKNHNFGGGAELLNPDGTYESLG